MKIKTSANNLEPLKAAINKAENEILICSAWTRGETLNKLLTEGIKNKIIDGDLQLKIIIRLNKKEDVKISGYRLFNAVEELGDNCQLKYCNNLHTKLYVIDNKYGLTGSFNLTGGGFGDSTRRGSNIETGVEYTEVAEVEQLKQQFYEIWNQNSQFLPSGLLGFCLNETSSSQFYMVGIKPLKADQFVQIKISDNELILAQIVDSIKINPYYLTYPMSEESYENETYKLFSNASEILNTVFGITEKEEKVNYRINIGRVRIKSRLIIDDNSIQKDVNRTAPDVGQEVILADPKILRQYFGETSSKPATLLSNREVEVGLDPEEILSKHMAVFGSTGSGKSYFVKKYVGNYLKNWMIENKGRVVIIDPHGEYASGKDFAGGLDADHIFPNQSEVENLSARVIDNVDDLQSICGISRLDSKQKDYLNTAMSKSNYKSEKFIELLEEDLQQETEQEYDIDWRNYLEKPIEEVYHQYLDSFKKLAKKHWQEEKAQDTTDMNQKPYVSQKTLELLEQLPDEIQESIKQKIINNQIQDFNSEFKKDIEPIIDKATVDNIKRSYQEGRFQLESHNFVERVREPGIYCINMNRVDEEQQRLELAADILRGAFNRAKQKRDEGGFKTLFVIEEAHNFAPERSGKSNLAYKYLKTIASEGRKFGVGLIVITQRPAYVSKDILAQCNSQAIFRLINPNDI
ncbi:MAG TPA: DUF87 domain-containing protein, partial [bacterium]|nr:DUF87 domain-containing protein [bacterium]